MFETFIIQPIFNLLVFIYAIIPGHDFGIAIILFTIVIRLLMWPMLRKQLHQTRLMRLLQPRVKEIKQKAKGDRQKEGQMLVELYKEYGVNPFTSLGLLFIQLPIFIGLFSGLRKLINDPQTIIDFSYPWMHQIGHMKNVVQDLAAFDESFLGIINTTDHAFQDGRVLLPGIVIALLAGVFQYLQTKQLTPRDTKAKGLSQIMRESAQGKQPEQGEINAAVGRNLGIFFAPMIAIISATSPVGLALYFATGGLVGLLQQRLILNQDVDEMGDLSTKSKATPGVKVRRLTEAEATVAERPKKKKSKKSRKARR